MSVLQPGEDMRHAALAAAEDGAQVLGVAGGDGSLRRWLGGRRAWDPSRGCARRNAQPLRSRSRARSRAPASALDAFYAGHERRVDVGRINGRLFINNVSLGVYAEMLADPARLDKLGVAQAKFQAAVFRPGSDERSGLPRLMGHRSRASSPWSSRTTGTSSHGGIGFGQRHRLDARTLQVSVLDASTLDELGRLLAGTL